MYREEVDRCLIFRVRKSYLIHSNGGVAQLGEHLLCKQGVIGSIPFISTRRKRQRGKKGRQPTGSQASFDLEMGS